MNAYYSNPAEPTSIEQLALEALAMQVFATKERAIRINNSDGKQVLSFIASVDVELDSVRKQDDRLVAYLHCTAKHATHHEGFVPVMKIEASWHPRNGFTYFGNTVEAYRAALDKAKAPIDFSAAFGNPD